MKPKLYVDTAVSNDVDEISLLKADPDETLKLDKQDSIFLNSTLTSYKTVKEVPTKAYVDSFSGNNRNRREMSTVFNDQNTEVKNDNLTNLHSSGVN